MTRYDNPIILTTSQGKPYYNTRLYPNIPLLDSDIYIVTTIGDRLDNIAYSYYNDVNLWWIIPMANNNSTKGSMFPIPGTQLRIPTDLSTVMQIFNDFNRAR